MKLSYYLLTTVCAHKAFTLLSFFLSNAFHLLQIKCKVLFDDSHVTFFHIKCLLANWRWTGNNTLF